MVRTVCPGLCVLRFEYLAAPTRRTTVTTVGTGLPNHCLHWANWFYFLNPSISSFLCWSTWSLLFEDFYWRLSQFPQSYFFSQFVFSLLNLVFMLFILCACFHRDDCASVLLCLRMSTYAAASRSWLRNFLTVNFLSDEFVKIAYSTPLVELT